MSDNIFEDMREQMRPSEATLARLEAALENESAAESGPAAEGGPAVGNGPAVEGGPAVGNGPAVENASANNGAARKTRTFRSEFLKFCP
jgi:hypothetical protein